MNNQLAIYIYNKRETSVERLRTLGAYFFLVIVSPYVFLRRYTTVVSLFVTICCFFFVCCYADECMAMNQNDKSLEQPLCTVSSGTPEGQEPYEDMGAGPPKPPAEECLYETIDFRKPPKPLEPPSSKKCFSSSSCCNTKGGSCFGSSCSNQCYSKSDSKKIFCCNNPCPKFCNEERVCCAVISGAVCGFGGVMGGIWGPTAPSVGFSFLGGTLGCGVGGVGGGLIGNVCGPASCFSTFKTCGQCMTRHCPNCKKTSPESIEMLGMGVKPSAPPFEDEGPDDPSGPIYENVQKQKPPITTQPGLYPGGDLEQLKAGYGNNGDETGGHKHSASLPVPVTTQPTSGGPGGIGKKADLLSGYHPGAHMSSLLGMQHVLVTTSEQVLTTLKALALRAYETTTDPTHAAQQRFVGGSALRKRSGTSCASMSALQGMQSFRPYTFFGGTDQYRSNLENKVRSGVAGLILNPTSRLSVGVSYNRHYDEGQEQQGMRVGLSTGSAKAKTILDGLSMVVAWNTEAAGFTGHVASCCGWGNAKTTRNVVHGGKDVILKGRPDVSLRGGAAQFGYNVQNKYLSCTPYIECLVSRVAWDPYTEVSGRLPCTISRNKEQIVEQNIGLRKSWKMNETATVQVWVAEVFGRRKTNTLTSRPSLAPLSRYEVSVPMHKRRYIRTEFGTSYRAQLTEVFMLNVDGRFRRSTKGTLDEQNMSLNLQYSY